MKRAAEVFMWCNEILFLMKDSWLNTSCCTLCFCFVSVTGVYTWHIIHQQQQQRQRLTFHILKSLQLQGVWRQTDRQTRWYKSHDGLLIQQRCFIGHYVSDIPDGIYLQYQFTSKPFISIWGCDVTSTWNRDSGFDSRSSHKLYH